MGEKTDSGNMMQQRGMLVGGLGLILAIFGVLEFLVPGMPFRGSGIGTLALIAGIVLLGVAFLRIGQKTSK